MARAKGLLIREEWFNLLTNLEPTDFKAVITSMIEYYKNDALPKGLNDDARIVANKIFLKIRSKSTNEACGEKVKPKEPKVKDTKSDPTLFDRFWAGYPKKVGKAYAKRCFDRLRVSEELLEKMLLSIEEQKKSEQWKTQNGAFIPNPSTWLNQGRWEDEITHTEKSIYDNLRLGETW